MLHTPAGGKPPETSGPQAAGAAAKPGTDSKIRTRVNSVDGLTYVFIPAGSFMMGCSPGDSECDDDEKPPHAEQIANGFWLGRTEVTQAAWAKVKGPPNPSHFKGDQLPASFPPATSSACRRKKSGSMRRARAPRVHVTGCSMTSPGMRAIAAGRYILWVSSRQMLSAYMTCWGTFGNGRLTTIPLEER